MKIKYVRQPMRLINTGLRDGMLVAMLVVKQRFNTHLIITMKKFQSQ
jgi:hypothetical protein